MTIALAALGSVAAAIVEFTILPYLRLGGVQPHLVFVLAVLWTVLGSVEGGLTVAFVGGLTVDVLAPRPLGSTAFTLLVVAGSATAFTALFPRARYIGPIVAVFILSVLHSVMSLLVFGALTRPVPVADPVMVFLPGAIADTVLAALIVPVVVAVRDRRAAEERFEW
jgi:rod shape-determining protein MreD